MKNDLSFGSNHSDEEWGCLHHEIVSNQSSKKIKICYVTVQELEKIAKALSASVQDTSWMMELDDGAHLAYRKTVDDTAKLLVNIFNSHHAQNSISDEFGEILVSMSSSRALMKIFDHYSVPIAELWKPQIKQNEGFDFHTVCLNEIINFGEAKYSGGKSPHGRASRQANRFIDEEKHFRDIVHLVNLVTENAIGNLKNNIFGVILAFSIKSKNPIKIISNVVKAIENNMLITKVSTVYLVGVSHGN